VHIQITEQEPHMTTLTITPSVPTYEVYKANLRGKAFWCIARTDQMAFIGKAGSRKQAVQIARLLAGFRGQVTIRKGG
jgi:hypothetical protein